ncbi:MAG TPA: GNAT family N-acetyltransferase [Candidatus Acidoferrales bacterium]|nr:GNAT family N-acetyltransferase [Candidatus Acidoferrales bacterium]
MTPRPARPPALRYRAARRTDVDTLADLALRAYRVSSLEARREFYTEHPRFSIRDVRVGELDGELVASLVLYPLQAWVRGQRVAAIGIGSVAVSPEHRRRGVADVLLRATLRDLRQRGDALCMLYAFRSEFYRRFGYGLIERTNLLSLPPDALPASEESRRVRRMHIPDRPAVVQLYDRQAEERGHFALARRPEWWDKRLWGYEGDWVVYEGRRRGQIEGYLQYQIDSAEGPWKLVLTVNEFVASTPAAHRGLWGYLHALRDQAVEIVTVAPGDELWLAELADASNLRGDLKLGVHRSSGHLGYGAMLRLVDVKAALEALPLAPHARGELSLETIDPHLPQNSRAWRLQIREGRLHVRPERAGAGGARALPRLVAPMDALGSIVAGTLSPVRAAEGGLVEDARGAAAMLEPWFRARPAFLHPMNAF